MQDKEKFRIQEILNEGFPLYEETYPVLYRNDASEKLNEDEWRAGLIYLTLVHPKTGMHPSPNQVKYIIEEVFDTTIGKQWTVNDCAIFTQIIKDWLQRAKETSIMKPVLHDEQREQVISYQWKFLELHKCLITECGWAVIPFKI